MDAKEIAIVYTKQAILHLYAAMVELIGEDETGKLWGEVGYPALTKIGWLHPVK